MRDYLIRRLLSIPPVLLVVSIVAFSLLYLLPGDAAVAMLGDEQAGDKELYSLLRAELGLDDPVYVQYGRWLVRVVQGDLGISIKTHQPVARMIAGRIRVTAELGILALTLALVIGLSTATISALWPGSKIDVIASVVALAGVAMPSFWLGVLLIYLFGVYLRLLPPTGYTPPGENLGLNLKMMIMPVLTMGTTLAAVIMRQTRAALIEVMQVCVSFNREMDNDFLREHVYDLQEQGHDTGDLAAALAKALEFPEGERIPVGIFYQDESTPAYEERIPALQGGPLVEQPIRSRRKEDYRLLVEELMVRA